MKNIFSALVVALLINPCFANDIIVDGAAKTLFNSSYNLGGDHYCKLTKCSLNAHCTFDRFAGPGDAKFECEINEDIVLDGESSELLFRDILDATETMDGKCSANYCELTSDCTLKRRFFRPTLYRCEIY